MFNLTSLESFELKDSSKAIAFSKNATGPMFGLDLNLSSDKAESNLGNSYKPAQGMAVDSMEAKFYLLGEIQVGIK